MTPVLPGARRGLFALALLAAAGCGAGRVAQTNVEYPVSDGVRADLGPLQIRDAYVETPSGVSFAPGGVAALYMSVSNTGSDDDTLTSVSSDAADSVGLVGPTTAPGGSTSVVVPAGALVSFGPEGLHLELLGLHGQLFPGQSVPVTLSFDRAGITTLDVPVDTPTTTPSPVEPSLSQAPGVAATP